MNIHKNTLESDSFVGKFKKIFHVTKGTTKEVEENLTAEKTGKANEEGPTFFKNKYGDSGVSIEIIRKVNERMIKGEKSTLLPPHIKMPKFTKEEINAAFKSANEKLAQDPQWQALEAEHQKQMEALIKQAGAKPAV